MPKAHQVFAPFQLSLCRDRAVHRWGEDSGDSSRLFVYPARPQDQVEAEYCLCVAATTIEKPLSQWRKYPGYVRHHKVLSGMSRFEVRGKPYNAYVAKEQPLYRFAADETLTCELESDQVLAVNVVYQPDIVLYDRRLRVQKNPVNLPLTPLELYPAHRDGIEAVVDIFYVFGEGNHLSVQASTESTPSEVTYNDAVIICRSKMNPFCDITFTPISREVSLYHVTAVIPS